MKTLLARMKTVVTDDATLKAYVPKVETVAPRTLPPLDQDTVPFIGLAPVNSAEQWVAQRKEATLEVEAYLVMWYELREYAIIGDDASGQKGLLDFVADFKSAVRANFFASGGINYLSKPTDIVGVEYTTEPYGDNLYIIVATVSLDCRKLFNA